MTYYFDTETRENAVFEDDDQAAAMEWVATHPAAVLMLFSPEDELRYRKYKAALQQGVTEPSPQGPKDSPVS